MLSAFTFADVSKTEKDALIALYNTANGKEWNNTWDLDKSVSEWYGITLENDKVIAINLSFNNLKGSLPSEISQLTALKELNLSFNKLNGQLPKSITSLENLEVLKLFSNGFSGAIPKDIGNLKNLKHL